MASTKAKPRPAADDDTPAGVVICTEAHDSAHLGAPVEIGTIWEDTHPVVLETPDAFAAVTEPAPEAAATGKE